MKGRNSWWDVEIFLIANGRLPEFTKDVTDKKTVLKVIDIAHKRLPSDTDTFEKATRVLPYAFHLYGLLSCKGGDFCPNQEDHEMGGCDE